MSDRSALEALATAWGVLPAYHDLNGDLTPASDEALLAVLRVLGCDIQDASQSARRLDERRAARWQRVLEPVNVVWSDQAPSLLLRLPMSAEPVLHVRIELEDGGVVQHSAPAVDTGEVCTAGPAIREVHMALPDLPIGYHQVQIGEHRAWLFVAPKACAPARSARSWGVFMPHHAVHSAQTRGVGNLSDLRMLGEWIAEHGAGVLGTLPMLATFLDEDPYEPGPYAPVSRQAWSEQLLDVVQTPEFSDCNEARRLVDELDTDTLRNGDHAAHDRTWAVQWRLLTVLARRFFEIPDRVEELVAWELEHPDMLQYARFRAATQAYGPWPTWPERAARGDLSALDLHAHRVGTWRYAQFRTQGQLTALGSALDAAKVDLYLDLPIGVHPDGWDAWRHQEVFARGVSAGAPPDPFFQSGQDWGFPPLHPEVSRATGHQHLVQCLRAHMAHARQLRLDHVMGFYRLYWVVPGHGAKAGVYVRYPADEWFAALCIESQRSGCSIIGENLGMVPPEVDAELELRGIRGMYVGQFAMRADFSRSIVAPKPGELACLNTHDTPTFAGWMAGEDLHTQHTLGWMSDSKASRERLWRHRQSASVGIFAEQSPLTWPKHDWPLVVAAGLYRWLASTDASVVLVNLEDLWGEERAHNVPGTHRQVPNWLRVASRSLEECLDDVVIDDVFAALQEARCDVS